uniref:Folate receptor-like domain-containing protein n=1 Tax=Chromera velia CCMP2878 TaxID=1169474 RepID=A0A0G4FJK8_9ALVE|eukprot:Cvel_3371.t1-p1 / transcript=Cvel_3371.t1 / gene=Cvel_3371 / organism=Chromera_velia_CCMP2878 / gene_product=hypothetical protein / transcript_product=hypothetical protein / location=Cvel_scaffold135:73163-74473(-) / protein_length=238 / sequence_SO=supercontig / SO=protein_coding / is_pseudo=false
MRTTVAVLLHFFVLSIVGFGQDLLAPSPSLSGVSTSQHDEFRSLVGLFGINGKGAEEVEKEEAGSFLRQLQQRQCNARCRMVLLRAFYQGNYETVFRALQFPTNPLTNVCCSDCESRFGGGSANVLSQCNQMCQSSCGPASACPTYASSGMQSVVQESMCTLAKISCRVYGPLPEVPGDIPTCIQFDSIDSCYANSGDDIAPCKESLGGDFGSCNEAQFTMLFEAFYRVLCNLFAREL